jgi:hypothetical protein
MFPQDIIQDTKGPVQLHRTRLDQTGTELGIIYSTESIRRTWIPDPRWPTGCFCTLSMILTGTPFCNNERANTSPAGPAPT